MAEGLGTNNATYKLVLIVNQQNQDISKNTSIVKWTLRLESTGVYSFATWGSTCKVYIDEDEVYNNWSQKSISAGGSITIASGTRTITHNSDGKKTISYNASYDEGSTKNYTPGHISCSGSLSLSTIPRASKPSLITYPDTTKEFYIGENITVHCNRKSNDFTHIAWLNYGSLKIKIAENVTDNFKFDTNKYLDTLYKFIPNNTKGIGSISLDTYNGSKLIGTNSVEFTANVPKDIVPIINDVSIKEADEDISTSPFFSKRKFFIQNISKLNVVIDAEGINYSTIKTYRVEINDTIYNTNNFTTEPLKKYGDNFIKITITDSRGRNTTFSQKIKVLEWSNPSLKECSAYRCDAGGKEDANGSNICLILNGLYSYLNFINNLNLDIYYKKKNEKEFIFYDTITFAVYIDVDDEEGLLEQRGVPAWPNIRFIIFFFQIKIILRGKKKLKKSEDIYREWQVPTAFTTIDYLRGGKGIAFGKVAEKEGLEINFITTLLKGIQPLEINNGDADEYKLFNIYFFNNNNANIPSQNIYILVIGNGNSCMQLAFSVEELKIYIKSYNSSKWSEWQER